MVCISAWRYWRRFWVRHKGEKVTKSFVDKLNNAIEKNHSLLCLGLDPEISKIPAEVTGRTDVERIKAWSLDLIEQTRDVICCIKPNLAFFEQYGLEGLATLKEVLAAVPDELPILLDAKRGDIGSTAEAHAKAIFEYWQADAVTVSPYLGRDGIAPFLKYEGKMVFVLCKTSNPSASEIQDYGNPEVYKHVAETAGRWGTIGQIGYVVGATQVESLEAVREIAPENWILAPGVGAQGGDLDKALRAGLSGKEGHVLVPVSRSIIFADNPGKAAKDLQNKINEIRSQVGPSVGRKTATEKEKLAVELFENGCVKFGNFTLASGKQSPIYVDLRRIISYPSLFEKCIAAYSRLTKGINFDLLGAVPYAALPAASGVSQKLSKPLIYPRKEAKTHGTGQMIEGAFTQGQTVLLIEDVITTGGSIVSAIQTLRDGGLTVRDVLVLVDRQQGGEAAMKNENINLHSVMTIKEIVEILHEGKKLEGNLYQEVRSYLDQNCN